MKNSTALQQQIPDSLKTFEWPSPELTLQQARHLIPTNIGMEDFLFAENLIEARNLEHSLSKPSPMQQQFEGALKEQAIKSGMPQEVFEQTLQEQRKKALEAFRRRSGSVVG